MLFTSGCQRDPYREMSNDQLLTQAANELHTFNFQLASEMYRSLLSRIQESDAHRAEVLFGLAISLQNVTPATPSNIDQSRQYYEQLLGELPGSTYGPQAMLQLGRIAEVSDYMGDPVDLETARARYQKVIDTWPDQMIADEAVLRLSSSYIQVYDDRESIEHGVGLLRDWLSKRPANPMASLMWQYMGKTYDRQPNKSSEALDAYLQADRIGLVNQATAGRDWWHMAKLAEQLERWDVAVRYHRKIIIEAPKSGRAWEAQQALKQISESHREMKITIPRLRSTFAANGPDQSADEAEVAP